ncbi:MAG: hypothetical protein D6814_00375 [Calditrichaeota bacterium]|nr:MAG: hypothetical protein D6814_00375 [Calditrichota bacterium]
MPNFSTRRTAIAILHYFQDHPTAKDTAAGIARWWVGEDLEIVKKALALLTKEGIVTKDEDRYCLESTSQVEPSIDKITRKLENK